MDRKERLTHERVNGIKSGYWSPETKEVLVQRLAEYENTWLTPEAIERMILTARVADRWISVKDKLPENTDHVLCCTVNKAGKQNIVRGYYDAESNGGMWACGMNNNVTHWMPLPDPPEVVG